MPKRIWSYVATILVTLLFGAIFQPLQYLTSLAQSGCQTFPQTNKQVCGRFLQYWQQSGGLAQQGLPFTNEFQEKSDLNGQTYTVQYFERAVFEKHPENSAPYDVLLSQLGTFRLKAKYPNGDPSPAATQATVPPSSSDITTAAGLVATIKAAGLPVAEFVSYTAETDPNRLLGRPNQYTGKANWHDSRLPAPPTVGKVDVSDGGGVEIWPTQAGAQARADYIANIGKNLPALVEYDYVLGKVLLRVSKELTPDQALAYKVALQKAGVK